MLMIFHITQNLKMRLKNIIKVMNEEVKVIDKIKRSKDKLSVKSLQKDPFDIFKNKKEMT